MTPARKAALQSRPIRIEGDIAYVPLTRGYEAIIDSADVPLVDGVVWGSMVKTRRDGTISAVYAMRGTAVIGRASRGTLLMHRVIAAGQSGLHVDHRDGDGLNNRRENLRLASNAENLRNRGAPASNSSGRKGVSWSSAREKWVAQIKADGRGRFLGYFDDPDLAHIAYVEAAKRLHGDFANPGRRALHGDAT